MDAEQRTILDELTKLSGQIVWWGGARVKILSPPTIRGQRVFISMDSIPGGSHYEIDRPLSEISNLRNRLMLEVPKVNAEIEIEIRRRAPDPNQKSPTVATVWRTRKTAVFLVFSRELSESDIIRRNRFRIARDKNDTSVIYLIVDDCGDKPSQKTKGRLGIVIKPAVSEWFFLNDYEVDICELIGKNTLKLTGK